MSAGGKRTRNKAQSMTKSVTDERATGPEIESPRKECPHKEDDFAAFIRSAVASLNDKLDSIITHQASLEKKLSNIEDRVMDQSTVIADLSESVEFNARNIKDQQNSVAGNRQGDR